MSAAGLHAEQPDAVRAGAGDRHRGGRRHRGRRDVEHLDREGLPAREATIKAMDEVTGPVIAIALVLSGGVRAQRAFIGGIIGQFFRQFAVTIAGVDADLGVQRADPDAGWRRAVLQGRKPGKHGEGKDRRCPGRARPVRRGLATGVADADPGADWLGCTRARGTRAIARRPGTLAFARGRPGPLPPGWSPAGWWAGSSSAR